MTSTSAIGTILERLGFIQDAATYLTGTCGIDSLEESAYLDGEDDVDTMSKGVTSPGGTPTTGMGTSAISSRNNGIPVLIRAKTEALCLLPKTHGEIPAEASGGQLMSFI
jgi:hypothetical protein